LQQNLLISEYPIGSNPIEFQATVAASTPEQTER